MKTLLPRFLAFCGAAAFGCALTLAFLPQKTALPEPSAAPEQPPLPPALTDVAEPPPSNELVARLFEDYHEAAMAEFVARPGNGYNRHAPVSTHPQFQFQPSSIFNRNEFTLIGNDPAKRRYQVEDPTLQGLPLVFRFNVALAKLEAGPTVEILPSGDIPLVISFQKAADAASFALVEGYLKPEVSLPTEAEFAILARFEASPEAAVELHPVPGGTLGYGAVRAAAACLRCHEKEEGALLGLFRYRFEHGPAASFEDLALR